MTEDAEAARERRLAAHRKYNTSSKGQARNLAYERRHPERKLRWEPARNALRSALGPAPETPMHNGADLPPEPAPNPAHVTLRQLGEFDPAPMGGTGGGVGPEAERNPYAARAPALA